MSSKVDFLTQPPGKPDEPCVLFFLGCGLIVIPTSNSVMRLIVTGEETGNAFCIVGTGGTSLDPIGFHYHRQAHDIFLCLKGEVNVWANDESRTLTPGDLASVPPISAEHTEFVGPIMPSGWEDFFWFIGEPYQGPIFPDNDTRNPFEALVLKLVAATEKYDMVPVRNHPAVLLMPH
ncbi:hypothetical protein W97_00002 [Coniosporium apollinis CBS 100218]|uniref:Cupin type-2 domain-containing protein n=1 Tax=Coniosporium apollinis (strain CBS 100218) TaxID=1168221 RepID=R7YFY4_CONA1|nr:uncharacterized protein W97_00002 [Coniosporium apollinis CBS 100218]EON60793.1 hypothetical protein W97_00002 [Coniosporium apollinis CBS 100218]